MNIGVIGMGRMGLGMSKRMLRHGHHVWGFDVMADKREEVEQAGVQWIESPGKLGETLRSPRTALIMVPSGPPTQEAIDQIAAAFSSGDVIIDGGNSNFRESMARAEKLAEQGIRFLDMGTSGGVWGLDYGFCLMVGGDKDAFRVVEPVLRDLAPQNGYAWVGQSGAGHFSKMVHNGIEYGMLQAYGEGFEILKSSQFDYDLGALAELWNHGSVVRSWLLELAKRAFDAAGDLEHVRGWVEDSGEGRWTVLESIEERVPAPVIALSLMMRFRSRQEDSFSAKVISELRNQFGGHAMKEKT